MKKLFILFLIGFSIVYSQHYKCERYYYGEINQDKTITWTIDNEINYDLFINFKKDSVIIENTPYSYKLYEVLENNTDFKLYYAGDNTGDRCLVLFEIVNDFSYFYFQYKDVMIGYLVNLK